MCESTVPCIGVATSWVPLNACAYRLNLEQNAGAVAGGVVATLISLAAVAGVAVGVVIYMKRKRSGGAYVGWRACRGWSWV